MLRHSRLASGYQTKHFEFCYISTNATDIRPYSSSVRDKIDSPTNVFSTSTIHLAQFNERRLIFHKLFIVGDNKLKMASKGKYAHSKMIKKFYFLLVSTKIVSISVHNGKKWMNPKSSLFFFSIYSYQ